MRCRYRVRIGRQPVRAAGIHNVVVEISDLGAFAQLIVDVRLRRILDNLDSLEDFPIRLRPPEVLFIPLRSPARDSPAEVSAYMPFRGHRGVETQEPFIRAMRPERRGFTVIRSQQSSLPQRR